MMTDLVNGVMQKALDRSRRISVVVVIATTEN